MKEILVVCAVIKENDRILIAQRKGSIACGIWEFPGGKVEVGKSLEDACVREIKEELRLDIQVDNFLCDIIDDSFQPAVHVYAYEAHIMQGTISLSAHTEYKWIHPEDVFQYQFQEADEPIKRAIQKR